MKGRFPIHVIVVLWPCKWTSLLYQPRVRCSSKGETQEITLTPEVDTIMMSIYGAIVQLSCTHVASLGLALNFSPFLA